MVRPQSREEILFKLDADTSALGLKILDVSKQFASLASNVELSNKDLKNAENQLALMNSKLGQTATQLVKARLNWKNLSTEQRSAVESQIRAVQLAQKAIEDQTASLRKLRTQGVESGKDIGQEFTKTAQVLTNASRTARGVGASLKTAVQPLSDMSKRVPTVTQTLKDMQRGLIGIGFATLFANNEFKALGSGLVQLGFFGFTPAGIAAASISTAISFFSEQTKKAKEEVKKLNVILENSRKRYESLEFSVRTSSGTFSEAKKSLDAIFAGIRDPEGKFETQPFQGTIDGLVKLRKELVELRKERDQLRQQTVPLTIPFTLPFINLKEKAVIAKADQIAKSQRNLVAQANEAGVAVEALAQHVNQLTTPLTKEQKELRAINIELERMNEIAALFMADRSVGVIRGFEGQFKIVAQLIQKLRIYRKEVKDRIADEALKKLNKETQKAVDEQIRFEEALAKIAATTDTTVLDKYDKLAQRAFLAAEAARRLAFTFEDVIRIEEELDKALGDIELVRVADELDAADKVSKELAKTLERMSGVVVRKTTDEFGRMQLTIENMVDAFSTKFPEATEAIDKLKEKLGELSEEISGLREKAEFEKWVEDVMRMSRAMDIQLEKNNKKFEKTRERLENISSRSFGNRFDRLRARATGIADAFGISEGATEEQSAKIQESLDKVLADIDKQETFAQYEKVGNKLGDALIDGMLGMITGRQVDFQQVILGVVASSVGTFLKQVFSEQVVQPAAAGLAGIVALAEGGRVDRPTFALIGERGPEWVLNEKQMEAVSKRGQQGVTLIVNNNADPAEVFQRGANPDFVRHVFRNDIFNNGPIRKILRIK